MRRLLLVLSVFVLTGVGAATAQQLSVAPGNEHFQRTWERTDKPVLDGLVARTWMWSPEAFTDVLTEPYAESPNGQRAVQYFDKARMEITQPDAGDPSSVWYVTNGLLVVEMVTGTMQVGDASFEARSPAHLNVAGDAGQGNGPTYAAIAVVLDEPTEFVGAFIVRELDQFGNVTVDPDLSLMGVQLALIDDVTGHGIAAPFWDFMNASGVVYVSGGITTQPLFENAYFATGRPITEPYWTTVRVGGTPRDVLIQCFERRCLTYTPGNPDGFVVEAGNVGQHYYDWRYNDAGTPPPPDAPTATATSSPPGATATTVPPTMTPTSPAPTATATATPTATATNTPTPTNTATSPAPNCHASYPDFCIPPPPPDLNCPDIGRTNFTVRHNVPNPDPHDLDRDKDGVGCES